MKKFFKVSFISILIISLIFAGWFAYYKYFAETSSMGSLTLIPEDAIFVVQTKNLTAAWNELSKSNLWKYMTTNASFRELDEDINLLNKYITDNPAINLMLEGRELLMSGHMTSGKDWDFVFIVDLQSVTMMKGGLSKALALVSGFTLSEREYHGEKIFELTDNNNPKSKVYMSIVNNLFVTTFTGSLIEKVIEQKDISADQNKNKQLLNNTLFNEVTQNLGGNELFKFYFNYKQLDKFSLAFLTESSESITMLSQSLGFSALNIFLENEQLSFDGYTNVDSLGSYLKALAGVKPGKLDADKIISDQASLYFSIGFDDFNEFYNNLIKQYESGNAEDMEDINKGINLTEKFLGISLKENFFDWIGNEIAFVKLRPNPEKENRLEDVVAMFHAKDIEKAKEGWGHIVNRINKRTVVKFKTENYKNFEINILERRGIFKIFLGKMFEQLEKPYFTFIDDYLVFSNSLETLKTIIDDYVSGRTLSHVEKFTDFKKNFEGKSNVSIFIRTPKIYQNLYYSSSAEDRVSIKENKEFILSFAQIGFQLTSKGTMFDTKLIARHDPEAVKSDELEIFEKEASETSMKDELDSLKFKIKFPEDSLVNDRLYIQKFDDSNLIKYEGHISNGNLNGLWKTYYESGNLRSSINYSNGKISGEAFFYYDLPGTIKHATVTFDNDEIINDYYEYYQSAVRKSKIHYEDGKPNGDAEFYYQTGELKIKAEYKDGLNDGKWIYLDEKGVEIGKEKWKNGKKK